MHADTTENKGGSGDHFRPHALLKAAYASCLNITVRISLDALKLPDKAITVEVEPGRRDEQTTFRYHIDRTGAIDEKMKQLVLKKSQTLPSKQAYLSP